MDNILVAFLLTLFAGLSTSIGGFVSFFIQKKNLAALALGLSFSAGVMIYVSFMEILPVANLHLTRLTSAKTASLITTLVFFGGMALAAIIDYLMPDHVSEEMIDDKDAKLKRAGLLTAVALAVHNFPEGLATFMAGMQNIKLGLPIAIAIAVHNIPEGISVALPIYNATGSRKKAFWYATLSGLTEPLGAIIGFMVLGYFLNDFTFGVLFALTAGIMIYISFDELLPMAKEYGEAHHGILGASLGMFVMAISLILLK